MSRRLPAARHARSLVDLRHIMYTVSRKAGPLIHSRITSTILTQYQQVSVCRTYSSQTVVALLDHEPGDVFSKFSIRDECLRLQSNVANGEGNIKCLLYDDSLYKNLLILNQDCGSYLKMYQGSGFLRHSVIKTVKYHASFTTLTRYKSWYWQ